MEKNSVEDMCWDLERRLSSYASNRFMVSGNGSNIPRGILMSNVRAYQLERDLDVDRRDLGPNIRLRSRSKTDLRGRQLFNFYFFDNPLEGKLAAQISGSPSIRLVLDRNNYGFSDDFNVEYDPRRVDWASEKISKDNLRRYEDLIDKTEVSLNDLLETAGLVVNESMKYCFDKFRQVRGHQNEADIDRLLTLYQPNGTEVIEGICSDAGEMIRDLLYNLNVVFFLPKV